MQSDFWFRESAIFTTTLEASTSKVASVSLAHLEQTVAGEVLERIQEQTMPERIEELIGDIPVPAFVEDKVEVVQIIPQKHLQQRTVDQEQITAGETAQNIVGFHSVPGQVKVQEFPEVQVIERIQEHIVFQGTVETTSVVPLERVQSQTHEHNLDVHTSVPERIEEQIGDMDEPPLKKQSALRVGDIVYAIGHGFLDGKVRVALLTEGTSIWESWKMGVEWTLLAGGKLI